MSQVLLDTSKFTEIIIVSISGGLRLKGWDRDELRGDPNSEDALSITEKGKRLEIRCSSGCTLRVPNSCSLTIKNVSGDLVLKSLEEEVEIGTVHGSAIIKNTNSVILKKCNGSITIKNLEGNLSVEAVMGDAVIQEIEGNVKLDDVYGDLVVRGIIENLNVHCKGDAVLKFEPELEGNYNVTSQGDIVCQVEPGIGINASFHSRSRDIRIVSDNEEEIIEEENYQFSSGEEETNFHLEADGDIRFIVGGFNSRRSSFLQFDFDFERLSSIGPEIAHQVTSELEKHLSGLNKSISNDIRQAARFEKKLVRKERELHQKAARMERRALRKSGRRRPRRQPISDPVSDLERQKILEMVSASTISVDDAEMLLSALEGNIPDAPSKPKDQSEVAKNNSDAPVTEPEGDPNPTAAEEPGEDHV